MRIPGGALLIVSDPGPVAVTVSVNCGRGAKSAVTLTGAVPMVNVQEPVPEQAPLQPMNVEVVGSATAFSVTAVPVLIGLLLAQVPVRVPAVEVQLTPKPPVSVTVPLPLPAPVTVTVVALKAALTDCAELIVTEQAPVPVQAPPQPANAVPAGAVGVSVTKAP